MSLRAYVDNASSEPRIVHRLVCDWCGWPIYDPSRAICRPKGLQEPDAVEGVATVFLHKTLCDRKYSEVNGEPDGWTEAVDALTEAFTSGGVASPSVKGAPQQEGA